MTKLSSSNWLLEEKTWDPTQGNANETLFALSNGSIGVRGTLSEMPTDNMAGLYLGGVYDRGEAFASEIVSLPNFLGLKISIDDQKFDIQNSEVLEHYRALDMKQGFLYRSSRLKSTDGKVLVWESWRLVSLVNPLLCAERHRLFAENFSGEIKVESNIDANCSMWDSFGYKKYDHFNNLAYDATDTDILVSAKLDDSRYPIVSASRLIGLGELKSSTKERNLIATYQQAIANGSSITFDRYMTLQSERLKTADAREQVVSQSIATLDKAQSSGFDELLQQNIDFLAKEWEIADFEVTGDDEMQKVLRYNICMMIFAGPRHSELTSIGARGLSGTHYGGWIYWDTEMFMLPYYVFTDPKIAKNILMYRYHTLDGARANARAAHCSGALYPVCSTDTGIEAMSDKSPAGDDYSKDVGVINNPIRMQEIHVGSSVAYGIELYYKATGDKSFMLDCGLEILIEITRYWCDRMEWNEKTKRYEILQVMGADEYHHDSDNNAYTNYMAWFNLNYTLSLCNSFKDEMSAVRDKLKLTAAEMAQWQSKMETLFLPQPQANSVIEQEDGWFKLKPYGRGDYSVPELLSRLNDGGGQHIPNALGEDIFLSSIDIDSRLSAQIVKQADIVQLLFVKPDLYNEEIVTANWDYYEPQTVHQSSLSPCISSVVATRLKKEEYSYFYFKLSAEIDMYNKQSNVHKGLHYAAIGGTWIGATYGFGGIYLNKDMELELRPVLPEEWKSFKYSFRWQGRVIEVAYDGKIVSLNLKAGQDIELKIKDSAVALTKDKLVKVEY